MKHSIKKPYAALLALVALLPACSRPAESSGSSATSATQQANTNSAQPPVAQGGTALATQSPAPLAVQSIPPPTPAAESAETTPAQPSATAATTPTASDARLPKLVAPDKRINFGKQPQDKTLVRAIIIRNSGRANLNIESVVPS
jgi:hypothetical protein